MKSNKELDLNFIDKLQDELADMSVGGIYSLYSITLSDVQCSWAAAAGCQAPLTPLFLRRSLPLTCLQDLTNEINEMMGQSFAVPEDVDEADLMVCVGEGGHR